ncbi:HlyU family transcriptional regulator [Maliponia aquimaris]|uniref:Transcriptional activator HlyU n=1 Tax=Maliponia aquimaris TaxID=1673631 RepID=A0A238KXZ9_9RHOB|nr:HlyU family transcriptional regulator [Maliponia aquimaris]SMX47597.1 Transcriptional activator HlyU [Maliponia aquimaris]
MAFWKNLFGGGKGAKGAPAAEAVDYEGFRITPQPFAAEGGYRIRAIIEGEVGGETRRHEMIRADVISDPEEAKAASVRKAQQMIDQMGARLFGV